MAQSRCCTIFMGTHSHPKSQLNSTVYTPGGSSLANDAIFWIALGPALVWLCLISNPHLRLKKCHKTQSSTADVAMEDCH